MDEEIKILVDDELDNCFAYDPFRMYLQEISQYPVLSKEEQKNLARLYKENNDLKARELLITCNLRLVVNVALNYKWGIKHFQILDLVQEGTCGLIRAIETYNPSKGAFSNYAKYWIVHNIGRGLENKNDEIRKPTSFIYATQKYIALINKYKQNGLPLPTDDDICDILDISIENLRRIRNTYHRDNMISLNQTVIDGNELGDIISGENDDYEEIINTIVDDNLLLVLKEVLTPLRYYIIYNRILSDERKTLKEIGLNLNITKERVRALEAKILRDLTPYMVENSSIFKRTLKKIHQREGYRINYLKRTPITPSQIISYMYLKDELTDLERKLYELNIFGKYTYSNEDYASILGITIEELNKVMITLKTKINKKFSDVKAFKHFQEQMIGNYGSRIYDIDLMEDVVNLETSDFLLKKTR